MFLQYFFPDLWFLLYWSPFMSSEYFPAVYVSCRKIWDQHFFSRLTKLANIFITNRIYLYQDLGFFILPTLPQVEDIVCFPRNSSISKFL